MRTFLRFSMLCLASLLSMSVYAEEIPNDEIWYEASEKLPEITDEYSSGLHTNAFNTAISLHTFSGGKGIIKFSGNVTKIGYRAFYECTSLTSITIPNSVTSIQTQAFGRCSGLTSITIPNSVTSIGQFAFSGCYSLTSITIPNSVTSIYDGAFEKCKFTLSEFVNNSSLDEASNNYWRAEIYDVIQEDGLCIKDNVAVSYRGKPTSITIPNSVTSIEHDAFYACSGLTSITIPNSAKSIGYQAFRFCSGLTSVTIPAASVDFQAFGNCSGMTSITITNSVKSIGLQAFDYCSGLTSIAIPNSVTSIREKAFCGCSGLTSIVVDSDNDCYDSRGNSNAIIEKSTNKLIAGCKNTIIPNSVTSIGNGAFYGCSGLISVTIPNSVTSIEESAFSDCSGVTSIKIPNSVTSIGKSAFYNCKNLTDVTVSWSTPLPVNSDTFGGGVNLSNVTLHVPVGTKALYQAADVWKDFGTIEEASPNITFADANVKSICVTNWDTNKDGELSEEEAAAVTSLDGKFKNNTTIISFAELSYFTGLTPLGEGEFSGCSSLASITIPTNITILPASVFSGCSFTSYVVPDNITTIGKSAFSGCTKLASVTLGSAVKNIGKEAFAGCTGLTSFTTKVADPATITLGSDVWKNVTLSNVPLTAPNKESLKKYSEAAQWSAFKYDIPKEVSLDENSDITSQLEELVNEGKRVDLTINRTFYCDGYFNTICLPFSMTAAEIAASPIGGYKELKKFVKADVKGKGKEMNVNVGLSATKEIEAGVPYLISWHKGANIVNPTFENVLVTESVGKTISGGGMNCTGILTPTVLDPTGNNLLFLGENNLLYWSSDNTALRAFRAYFSVNSVSMVNFRKDMPAFFVDIDEVTGIGKVQGSMSKVQSVKYLENGKVVIERNGVKYDAMGRVIK